MKKKVLASLIAALFVGSCFSVEIAMAANNVKTPMNSTSSKKEMKPVYAKNTKNDGAKKGTPGSGKPTNVRTEKKKSKSSNDIESNAWKGMGGAAPNKTGSKKRWEAEH